MRLIKPGLYALSIGFVNVFLLDTVTEGLILVDTGSEGHEDTILQAIENIGKRPQDLKHILLTHAHPDHAGSLAALKKTTGAQCWMHPEDAQMVREGRSFRKEFDAAPGLLNAVLYKQFIEPAPRSFPPSEVENEVEDGDIIPVGGGIRVIHTPGHSRGHLSFLWESGEGVVFVGDAAVHQMGLRTMLAYEDYEEGLKSLKKLSGFSFSIACFGHGRPLKKRASHRFYRKWGRPRLQRSV